MSQLNIRTLLSKSVTAIKNKLGLTSLTWGEYETKLAEAMQGGSPPTETIYISDNGTYDVTDYASAFVQVEDHFYADIATSGHQDELVIGPFVAHLQNCVVYYATDTALNSREFYNNVMFITKHGDAWVAYYSDNYDRFDITSDVVYEDGVLTVNAKCDFKDGAYRVIAW